MISDECLAPALETFFHTYKIRGVQLAKMTSVRFSKTAVFSSGFINCYFVFSVLFFFALSCTELVKQIISQCD